MKTPPAPGVVGTSHGQVDERNVLPRRRRRQRPSAPVPERPLQLPRQRPKLAMPRAACGTAWRKAPALCRLEWRRYLSKRKARRGPRQTGGRAERGWSCGRTRTRGRRSTSSSASWTRSGASSDAESEDLGHEPSSGVIAVSRQYPGGLLRSFLRTIGSQVVMTGDTHSRKPLQWACRQGESN